jgi:hypothetical protein
MSFPSVTRHIAQGKTGADALLAAVKEDCPEAVEYLHRKAHEAKNSGVPVWWSESPNSTLGKQLIRIHASDAVRPLIEERVCHGQKLQFVNCCNGQVGGDKKTLADLVQLQIECQDGTLASADC